MDYRPPQGFPLASFESIQGRRWNMEDAHVNIDDLSEVYPDLPNKSKFSFYAVFDGHGGKQSADMCEKHLLNYLVETEAFKKGEYLEAFRAAYEKMENFIADKERPGGPVTDGCTAVTVLIVDNKMYVANVGDSECIVGRLKKKEEAKSPDDTYGYTLMTAKHLPSEAPEKERLLKAGAMVQANRINGILAVSRSFGDLEFKTKTAKGMQAVIAEPHLSSYELSPADHFLVVGCDGVWDTTTYDEAVDSVASTRYQQRSPLCAAETLVKEALDDHTMDNVTVIVVYLQPCPTFGEDKRK